MYPEEGYIDGWAERERKIAGAEEGLFLRVQCQLINQHFNNYHGKNYFEQESSINAKSKRKNWIKRSIFAWS